MLFVFRWYNSFWANQLRYPNMALLVQMHKIELKWIKDIYCVLWIFEVAKKTYCVNVYESPNAHNLRMQSSTSTGSQIFSTVQFEYQNGKFPLSNILPLGHRYLENSLWYRKDPPFGTGGGCCGQGSTIWQCNSIIQNCNELC